MVQTAKVLLESGVAGLGRLFEQERAHLRRFLERRINRKLASRLDASDVIQEVFFRAQQSLPSYLTNPTLPPVIWLRHLSSQVLCEVHRKHFRAVRNPYREGDQIDQFMLMRLTSSTMSIASKLERIDLQSKVSQKLKELNEMDRQVLEMRHVDGYSLAEIATILEVQYDTTKKRYYRALKRFKDLLEATKSKSS